MTSKHVAALALAILLGLGAGALVLLCGKNTNCSAPGVFQSITSLATMLVTLATAIVGGVFGHAKSQDEARRGTTYTNLPAMPPAPPGGP